MRENKFTCLFMLCVRAIAVALLWVAKTDRGHKEDVEIRENPGLSPVSLLCKPEQWHSILG